MTAILRSFTFLFSLSTALTLPSNTGKPPLAIESINSTTQAVSWTVPNPQEYNVDCLNSRIAPKPSPLDCSYVISYSILSDPNIFTERRFQHYTYETDTGLRVPARWQYNTCEVTVFGPRHAHTQLTLYAVALLANRIIQVCVTSQINPIGGLILIGEGFHVIVQGNPRAISAENSTVSQRPAVSVSRRIIHSQHDSETAAGSGGLVTRDQLASVSTVSNELVVPANLTLPT